MRRLTEAALLCWLLYLMLYLLLDRRLLLGQLLDVSWHLLLKLLHRDTLRLGVSNTSKQFGLGGIITLLDNRHSLLADVTHRADNQLRV